MKKFIIVEVCVIIAIVLGFWIGRITSPFNNYAKYYENADKAWSKVLEINSPTVTYDDPDQDRLREVRAACRAVFENYPDSRWADDALHQLASLPRTDEEGFALFRRLIRDYPDSELADDSMYAIAIATYEIAEELKKTGTLESLTAYYDRALALFNQLNLIYPGSVLHEDAQFNIAMCYYGRGDVNSALSELEALKIERGNNSITYRILFQLGTIYLEQHDYENARVEFQNVVDSGDPEHSHAASFSIAQSYLVEGEYEEAAKGYQKVIDLYPDTEVGRDAHFYIGWAYANLENYDEAIRRLQGAVENYPNNKNTTTTKFYIAQVAEANKDTALAIETYQNFADDSTHNYDHRLSAQYHVGRIFEENGDIEQAVDAYEKFFKDFPEPHQNPAHDSRKITENYIQKLKAELSGIDQ